ncbi:MAG: hypothetical protein CEO22_607 [Candidatus Berkelbacteria bacterium Gr01-1014_85]|uniref:DUF3096 domain-containing protein n=1 Tax=Candidatus Berkelbacteria bacterium Gr01-1014_85 TaxID=2017150 RepID=A0A554J9T1_9BACT|nr:MAG: hypothetical protein CEO22_607 [Candidatus Berkelbacteria bacterium Gr01-1014_85]
MRNMPLIGIISIATGLICYLFPHFQVYIVPAYLVIFGLLNLRKR